MKKLLALALFGLCGSAIAQTNPAPATPAQNPPAAAPASSAPSPTTGVEGGRNAVYTDRIPPEQMITLDANGDKFQARHVADLSGLPRGAAIILHDSGQHPSWPFTAAALIDELPLHGWDTLNIELPAPTTDSLQAETPTVPAATSPATATNNPTSANPTNTNPINATTPATAATPTTTGVESRVQARINAAIKYFSDQNQHNIVLIGFGSGAIREAETLRLIAAANTPKPSDNSATKPGDNSTAITAPITALVMIAPQQQLSGIELDLPKLLPLTGTSALDMTLDSEPQARAEAEARRRAVLHQRTRVYTRLELPPINNSSDAQHSAMVKRVRAWLQKQAYSREKPPEKNSAPNALPAQR